MPLPDVGAPALTTVRFDLVQATGGDGYDTPPARLPRGRWTFTPVPGALSEDTRLSPTTFQVRPTAEEIEAGFFVLDLFATDDPAWLTAWCWKVRPPFPAATRHVAVPRSATAVDFDDLTDIDPTTLAPVPGQRAAVLAGVDADRNRVPDWFEALVRDQTIRIAELEAAVLGLQARLVADGQAVGPVEAYATAPIGDSPAAVQAYVETHVETPAQAGYIGGYFGGTI